MLRDTCENKTLLTLTVERQLASSLLQNHMIHMVSFAGIATHTHTVNLIELVQLQLLINIEIWVA